MTHRERRQIPADGARNPGHTGGEHNSTAISTSSVNFTISVCVQSFFKMTVRFCLSRELPVKAFFFAFRWRVAI